MHVQGKDWKVTKGSGNRQVVKNRMKSYGGLNLLALSQGQHMELGAVNAQLSLHLFP